MAASSVTGVGPGESNGLYKPQNNSGCGCCVPQTQNSSATVPRKNGCFRRHSSSYGTVRYSSSSVSVKSKSCI